jgi:hypothetical protein
LLKKGFFFFFLFFYFLQPKSILLKNVHYTLSNHQEVLVLRLLREIIFCNYEKWYLNESKKYKNKIWNNICLLIILDWNIFVLINKNNTNKISNFEICVFWNIYNTIFNMLVIDEIIQCPRVCVHLQTNTGVSGNAHVSKRFRVFTHIYFWIIVIPAYMGCCYNNKINQLNRKVKYNKSNNDGGTNHLWELLISIQMQCLFLIR